MINISHNPENVNRGDQIGIYKKLQKFNAVIIGRPKIVS